VLDVLGQIAPNCGDRFSQRQQKRSGVLIRAASSLVWTLGPPAPGTLAASWGHSVEIDQVKNLYAAFADLQKELRTQRIVLVEGRHLPQSLTLGPAARGVALVGAAER